MNFFFLKIVKSVRNITAEFDENILVNLHKIQISISLIRQIKFSFSESLDWNEFFTEIVESVQNIIAKF